MEYWIVYDLASGEQRWRGSGTPGTAAQQELGDGLGMVLVPAAAVRGSTVDLDIVRAASAARIDAEAEAIRQRFITALPGQIGAYLLKANAARRWLADNSAPTWMLQPEATSRRMSLEALCAEVLQREADWERAAGAIEGLRLGAKDAVEVADSIGAIVIAATVDWAALGG
ncbi:hypothetical protein LPN01_09720 [Sphingomonas sp. A2-49]|uniref:hypothetical protein n=1 Tax=Sphingomonas sp. A2-49 TaxID=1391375 RepID=UPI0021D06DB6|nr:hypothetical protein [Sphingomonas sp. A2-49]MCU6454357.1 hypothetical protein [Sphingomonas sp. A2-49]